MKFDTFLKNTQALKKDGRITLIGLAASSVATLLLSFKVIGLHERIVVIPPHLDQRIEVAYDDANKNYDTAYATYVATLVGNVTPGNVDFILEATQKAFSSNLYNSVRKNMIESAESMKRDGRTLAFRPDGVTYDPETDHTFVHGIQDVIDVNGNSDPEGYVYEFKIDISNGLPVVTVFDRYPGNGRAAKNKRQERERKQRNQKRS